MTETYKPIRVLELFSGTHSIGKVCKKHGFKVYSLDKDLDDKCPFGSKYKSYKHMKIDIFDFKYEKMPVGYFDIITASPVCLWWSNLRNTWIGRKLKGMTRNLTMEDIKADIDKYGKPMVDRVLDIIKHFKPKYWWIENPATGKMRHYLDDKCPHKYVFSYCKYSDWGYQKNTACWTNIEGFKPLKCKKDCKNIIEVKTRKGAIHKGTKQPIKSKTRVIHKQQIGDRKAKDAEVIQKIHKTRMGSSKTIKTNDGKIVRCNTKALRKRYRHKKDVSKDIGGGSNRLERYRIPEGVIEELLKHCEFEKPSVNI